jgi:uncharacterized protein YjiS (DUF1127 family)
MALFSIAKKLLSIILIWIEISNQRRVLRELTDRQLADIGVCYEEAMHEAGRTFWDHSRTFEQGLPVSKVSSDSNSKEHKEFASDSCIIPGQ